MHRSALDLLTNQPVEGDTLAARLARGRLAGDEVLRFAIEIGAALAAAHAQGLVHGSLSPQSIVLTASGARILCPASPSDPDTVAYSAPELLAGKSADTLSDIFSFGAVLYEMAAGRRAFPGAGEDLERQIRDTTPTPLHPSDPYRTAMQPVVDSCLTRDPAARRQRVHNAVVELKLARTIVRRAAIRQARAAAPAFTGRSPARARPAWLNVWAALLLLALVMVTVTGMAAAALAFLRGAAPSPEVSFRVTVPDNLTEPSPPVVSPDGSRLVFAAIGPDGRRMLWVRPLDDLRLSPIPGTENASAPFWSPDSLHIGFFANESLKRVPLRGGAVQSLCRARALGGGGAWNSEGTILFAPGLLGGLYTVPATGGSPQPLLNVDPARFQVAFLWPQFLPGGRHFVFFAMTGSARSTGVYLGDLRSPGSSQLLFPSTTNAVYSPAAGSRSRRDGFLLFARNGIPMAQPFQTANWTVQGAPFAIGDPIGSVRELCLVPLSVSANATLVYQPLEPPGRRLVWFNRGGQQETVVRETGDWEMPRISPAGNRAVAAKAAANGETHLWLIDRSGDATPLDATATHEESPVWSPDGMRIAFASRGADPAIVARNLDGAAPASLYAGKETALPTSWSGDGRFLLFTADADDARTEIRAHPVSGAGKAVLLIRSHRLPSHAVFSPNGQWIAYQADESGKPEVYVQPFEELSPASTRRWRVSSLEGGSMPRWRGDGRELFYLTASGTIMSVPVRTTGGDFEHGEPVRLFETRAAAAAWTSYDAAPDGQRFLVNLAFEGRVGSTITVLTNWTGKLRRTASQPSPASK